jgi:NAD(P)H-hydrate epimerase
MRELDRKTIQEIGIPGAVLMENAGRGTFDAILRFFPEITNGKVAVIAGGGNNGGDGFVIARYLLKRGIPVSVYLFTAKEKIQGDAARNLMVYRNSGGAIQEVTDEQDWKSAFHRIKGAQLIVDALFGTGLSSEISGLHFRVIEDLNAGSVPIVSVDVPSGIDASTGKVLGIAVKAARTCTFGLPKRGLVIFPGVLYAGKLDVIDIGIPQSVITDAHAQEHLLEEKEFQGSIPARDPESHKGAYGHAFILAGSPGKTGAAALAGQAAMRVGAGLVTIGTPAQLNPILEIKVTEVMTEPLPDDATGFLDMSSLQRVTELLPGKAVVAIGPGISDREETARLVHKTIEAVTVPMVIDADGLNAIARAPEVLKKAHAPVVLTPHPGEMARLMSTTTQAVQADRIGTAKRFAGDYGVIVILKGARTIIAEPGGHVYINPTGNPGMASGGMGDVLTGMISGFLAQGLDPVFSARISVFMHGLIADEVASRIGPVGIIAADIIDEIQRTLKKFTVKNA